MTINRQSHQLELDGHAATAHAQRSRNNDVGVGWLKVASASFGAARCLRLLDEHKRELRNIGTNVRDRKLTAPPSQRSQDSDGTHAGVHTPTDD